MALVNPSSLYTGGSAVVNTQPHTNFLITALAKKQAQEDALDQYYRQVQDRLSENEIRPVDAEGFQSKFNGLQDYYIKNKKAILGGNISANNEYGQMFRDLVSDAHKSKLAASNELKVAQQRFSGKWQPTDEDIQNVHKMGSSIYDPNYYTDETQTKPVDLNSLSFNIPDVTPNERNQMMKGAIGGIKQTEVAGEPDKQKGVIPYTSSYRPEDIKNIATNYANGVASNQKFRNSYERLMHDATVYPQYNEAYKKYFPGEGDIQSPEQMAAAEAAIQSQGATSSRMAKYTDPNEWYNREAVKQRDAKERIRMNLGNAAWLKKQPNYKDIEGSDDDIVSTNKVIGEVGEITRNGTPSAEGHGWMDVNDPTVLKDFKDLSPSTTSPPNGMRYNPITNQMKFIYKDSKGNEEYVGIEPSSYLKYKVKQTYPGKDIGKINNAIGQLYENSGGRLEAMMAQYDELTNKAAMQKAPDKTYQHEGKTYTQDQIERGAKFYKLSVKDYLNKLGIK